MARKTKAQKAREYREADKAKALFFLEIRGFTVNQEEGQFTITNQWSELKDGELTHHSQTYTVEADFCAVYHWYHNCPDFDIDEQEERELNALI